jgi:hypothetical protein
MSDDSEESALPFPIRSFGSFIFVCVLSLFWWSAIPFHWFEPFSMGDKSTMQGVIAAWPMYLWGGGLNLFAFFATNNYREDPIDMFVAGTAKSILAGVLEEISFRWWLCLWSNCRGNCRGKGGKLYLLRLLLSRTNSLVLLELRRTPC